MRSIFAVMVAACASDAEIADGPAGHPFDRVARSAQAARHRGPPLWVGRDGHVSMEHIKLI